MAKRLRVTVTVEHDILVRLRDLHRQATEERSHYYVGRCVSDAINEITALRRRLGRRRPRWRAASRPVYRKHDAPRRRRQTFSVQSVATTAYPGKHVGERKQVSCGSPQRAVPTPSPEISI
jgi:hypothetical protein